MSGKRALARWALPGIGLKRWLGLVVLGILALSTGIALGLVDLAAAMTGAAPPFLWILPVIAGASGAILLVYALVGYSQTILAPYRQHDRGGVLETVYQYSRRQKGPRIVAIGGGTGLPATLRAIKPYTANITAIVTVADDGGSSGRLRRELGVLPPGDLRNNIAALADDENLMTRLFQHRFSGGELGGHAFGNLFISALANVTGSLESALVETGRVLNIQGEVFPATLEEVDLVADVRVDGRVKTIRGESQITAARGTIERISLTPADAEAFNGSVSAILSADIVVLGPGSLFTSILPNLLVPGIREALQATSATKIYVCNIATQPGETTGFTVGDHVAAIEAVVGRGVLQVVLANDTFPEENAGANTQYVAPLPANDPIAQRYTIRSTNLVDAERPWRHDPVKLAGAILAREGATSAPAPVADVT